MVAVTDGVNVGSFDFMFTRIQLLLLRGESIVSFTDDSLLGKCIEKVFGTLMDTVVAKSMNPSFRTGDWVPEWSDSEGLYSYVKKFLYFDPQILACYKGLTEEQEVAFRILLSAFLISTKEVLPDSQRSEFFRQIVVPVLVVSTLDKPIAETDTGLVDFGVLGLIMKFMLNSSPLTSVKRADFDCAYHALIQALKFNRMA